jgi:hypothetical protein
MAQVARAMHARAVAVSVSEGSGRRTTNRQLAALRDAVPRRVTVLAGGAGAPPVPPGRGIAVMRELVEVDTWSRGLAAVP